MGMNLNFVNEVKMGKRVFGNPQMRLSNEIKDIEDSLMKYRKKFGAGDFVVPNKELQGQLKDANAQKLFMQKCGEYVLRMVNKLLDEPFRNMMVFCDVELECGERVQFVLQSKYQTYLVNFAKASSSSPVYVMENEVYNSESKVVLELSNPELSEKERDFGFTMLDVCYTDSPLLILKNDNYYQSSSRLINISELKSYIDNDKREELGSKRYEILDYLYYRFYRQEETDFVKKMKDMLNI